MMMIGTLSTCSPHSSSSLGCRPPLGKPSSVRNVFSVVMQHEASWKPDGAVSIHSRGGGGLCCCCGRRNFIQSLTTATLFPVHPAKASDFSSQASVQFLQEMLNKVHPPRQQWYEELQAFFLDEAMRYYENEIAGYKEQLFSHLEGKAKEVLEIGIGTGPNIKYYARNDVNVVGLDPKAVMERYARAAAVASGVPPNNFKFLQAVGEAIPLADASVDAVVGTLVLCSVANVDQTLAEVKRVLKPGGQYAFIEHVAADDGTIVRHLQNFLDPLQQAVADGCHLTRETEKNISGAGFSRVDLNTIFLTDAFPISPHIYGIASM